MGGTKLAPLWRMNVKTERELLATLPADNAVETQSRSDCWSASLHLAFGVQGHRTTLRYQHLGPLRIQKALYPDGPACCQAVIVHPPGGIAGGDDLRLSVSVEPKAHACVTTPAATKWYGSFDKAWAWQTVEIDLHGRLEWLPCETIIFDQARVQSKLSIKAGRTASMLGWDLLIFGRHGSGELFNQGHFNQWLSVAFDDDVVWLERLSLAGADRLFDSPIGFNGCHAMSCLWSIAPADQPWTDDLMDQLRHEVLDILVTRLHPRLLVVRQCGDPIDLRRSMQQAWHWFKEQAWQLPANPLRLWAT